MENHLELAPLAYDGVELEVVQAFLTLTDIKRSNLSSVFANDQLALTPITFSIDEVLEMVDDSYLIYDILNVIDMGHIAININWQHLVFCEDSVKMLIREYL